MDIVQYKVNELKGDTILKLALCELLLINVQDKFHKRLLFAKVDMLCNNKTLSKIGKEIGLERFPGNKYSDTGKNKVKPYADAFEVLIYDCYEIDGMELVKLIVKKYLLK